MFADSMLRDTVIESGDPYQEVRTILGEVLQLGPRAAELESETLLLGNLPELDSMAVVTLITALEEHFAIFVDDDDDLAGAFTSLGTLVSYITEKLPD